MRQLLPSIPLERIMLETGVFGFCNDTNRPLEPKKNDKTSLTVLTLFEIDAPWMNFVKQRRYSQPADVVMVMQKAAKVLGLSEGVFAAATTHNARRFFQLPLTSDDTESVAAASANEITK